MARETLTIIDPPEDPETECNFCVGGKPTMEIQGFKFCRTCTLDTGGFFTGPQGELIPHSGNFGDLRALAKNIQDAKLSRAFGRAHGTVIIDAAKLCEVDAFPNFRRLLDYETAAWNLRRNTGCHSLTGGARGIREPDMLNELPRVITDDQPLTYAPGTGGIWTPAERKAREQAPPAIAPKPLDEQEILSKAKALLKAR